MSFWNSWSECCRWGPTMPPWEMSDTVLRSHFLGLGGGLCCCTNSSICKPSTKKQQQLLSWHKTWNKCLQIHCGPGLMRFYDIPNADVYWFLLHCQTASVEYHWGLCLYFYLTPLFLVMASASCLLHPLPLQMCHWFHGYGKQVHVPSAHHLVSWHLWKLLVMAALCSWTHPLSWASWTVAFCLPLFH